MVAGLESDGHEREVAPIVDRALAHERDRDRHVEALGERPELGGGVPSENAVPGQDERASGPDQEPRRVGDRLVRRLGEVGPGRLDRARLVVHLRGGKVLGKFDVGGAGLLQLRDPERLADDLRERADVLDALVPFRHRLEHPDDVDELVGLLVGLVGARLAGDRDHRRMVEEGIGDAGDEVRRAGPQGRHRDGRPSGEPAVHVGHERGALLMAGRDVGHGRLTAQRVEDAHRLFARDREDVLAALGREAVHEQRCGRAGGLLDHPGECTLGHLRKRRGWDRHRSSWAEIGGVPAHTWPHSTRPRHYVVMVVAARAASLRAMDDCR